MRNTHCKLCKQPLPPGPTVLRGRPIRYCDVSCRKAGQKLRPSKPLPETVAQARRVLERPDAQSARVLLNARRTLKRVQS